MKHILILIFTTFILSCQSQSDRLFWIDKNTDNQSDFLFMAESTNRPDIAADSLREFLNSDEIRSTRAFESNILTNDTILPTPVRFKNFGEIYKSDKFKINILLRIGNDSLGRDYQFLIRSYSLDWKIIDNYTLAIWNESEKKFCYGSINKKLIIERKCDDSETSDNMQITKDGKIIMTSYHKP